MPDYNLAGLSPRTFEQLIQAIAAKLIGPGIVVFGDGPDGAREATFEGQIPYPFSTDKWCGYGVVQAKFRQRPGVTDQDGTWALQQLRAELSKLADKKRGLRRPEYYIFATNVVLSPVAGRGAKDRVNRVIQEFRDTLPIKDFRVWDYDQIRTFLDDHEEIRKSYAAWITPGDVLAQMSDYFVMQRPDFDSIIANYLEKEFRADQCVNLGQAGYTTDTQTSLARVFIDLPVSDKPIDERPEDDQQDNDPPPEFLKLVIDTGDQRLDPETISLCASHKDKTTPQIDQAETAGRFVVLGGPGQGKTTISQFICQLYRALILDTCEMHHLTLPTRQAIDVIKSQCELEKIRLPLARRFPLRIVLSEYASELASPSQDHATSVLGYITKQINRRTDATLNPNDFRKWLGGYPWLLVLDGLDEVPSSSNRDDVVRSIRDFWVDATHANADLLVIATTRPQGYNNDFSPDIYQHWWLSPLSSKRAVHYAKRLIEARYGPDSGRREQIMDRLQQASRNSDTVHLMRSPLQVTIMTTLIDQGGQPPRDRWSLFNQYYDVIYRREVERNIPAAEILRDYRSDIDALHKHVGLVLQMESEKAGGTDASISGDTFAKLVDHRLRDEGHEGKRLENLCDSIIQAAMERLVFLVGLESDRIGFEIRSLQEFMAAEALMDGSDEKVVCRLRAIAKSGHWRNVFLFAAGKCFAERQHLRDNIYAICNEANDIEDPLAHATLTGSVLALELLEDGAARRQPKSARTLANSALCLLDIFPSDLHRRLAGVYQEDFEALYRENLDRHLDHTTKNKTLAAWKTIAPLVTDEIPWALELAQKFWPDDIESRLRILEICDRFRWSNSAWLTECLADIIPNLAVPHLPRIRELLFITLVQGDMLEKKWSHIRGYKVLKCAVEQLKQLPDSKVTLKLDGSPSMVILYRSMLSNCQERQQALTWDPSKNDGLWAILAMANRFSKEPKCQMLGAVLEAIAVQWEQNRDTWNKSTLLWLAEYMPWPIAACMQSCTSSEEMRRRAEDARSGLFGNGPEWTTAEKRWYTNGVNTDDVLYMTDARWPFDKHIGRIGFPFILSCLDHGTRDDWEQQMQSEKNILTLYKKLPSSKMRTVVANWWVDFKLDIINVEKAPAVDLDAMTVQSIFTDIGGAPVMPWGLNLLYTIYRVKPMTPESLALFEWLGSHLQSYDNIWIFHWGLAGGRRKFYQQLANDLSAAFRDNPQKVGLLEMLAFLAICGAHPSVPNELLNHYIDVDNASPATLIIRLAQGNWSDNNAEDLAAQCMKLRQWYQGVSDAGLLAVDIHLDLDRRVERFILCLRDQLAQTDDWNGVTHADELLFDYMRRQVSGLSDLRKVQELDLAISEGRTGAS